MRQKKFRAWDDELKEMVYNLDTCETRLDSDGTLIIGRFDTNEDWYELEPLEFTGQEDKNRKEIYDGDILSTLAHSEKIRKNPKYLKVVEWIGAGFNIRNGKGFEVIGNIYENPELLEANKCVT